MGRGTFSADCILNRMARKQGGLERAESLELHNWTPLCASVTISWPLIGLETVQINLDYFSKKWSHTSLKINLGLDSLFLFSTVLATPFNLKPCLFTLLTDNSILGMHQPFCRIFYETSLWHCSSYNKYSYFLIHWGESAFGNMPTLIFDFFPPHFFRVRTDLNLYGKLNCVLPS